MKRRWTEKANKALLLAAQGILLVVCATTLAWWSKTDGSEVAVGAEESETYLPFPTEDEQAVWNAETEASEGDDAIEDVAADSAPPADGAPVEKTAPPEIYRAPLRLSVEERVADLFSKTPIRTGQTVQYDALLRGEPLAWQVPRVLVRFDELAYIYWEALKVKAPKIKEGKLVGVNANVDGATVYLELTVDFEVTNKLLSLVMGTSHERAKVKIEGTVENGGVKVGAMRVEGSKAYSDSMIKLGSDFLFGTEDYVAYIRSLVDSVDRSLGTVDAVSATMYGVVFDTTAA